MANPAQTRRVRIKICGIRRPGDAEALDALSVDYLGFNFHPASKRFVEPGAAAEMISHLKNAEPVGVFVDASPDHIAEIIRITGIRWVQLHGHEGWDVLEKISLPVIKAIPHTRLRDYGGLKAEWESREGHPRYFLVDTFVDKANNADSDDENSGKGNGSGRDKKSGTFGGSGKVFDWSLLKTAALPAPFFLAGGLGPENLEAALKAIRPFMPFAVDLNSKVETAPGIKDIGLVKRCLEIVNESVNEPVNESVNEP
jgi:phosphoribosylanthranilate isomerase